MGRCDVALELASAETVPAGGVIEGVVVVTTSKETACRDVGVTLAWSTSGKGTVQREVVSTTSVFSGTLVAGEPHRLPFAVPVPYHPLSYEGTVVSVGWTLQAQADIAWARDAQAVTTVWVGPAKPGGPPAERVSEAGAATADVATVARLFLAMGIGAVLLGGLLIASGALGTVALLVGSGVDARIGLTVFVALAGLLITAIGVAMARRGVKPPLLDPVSRVHAPDCVHPGTSLPLQLVVQTTTDQSAEAIDVELVCEEVAVSTHGTRRVISRHTVWSQTWVLAGPTDLAAGVPVELPAELAVPDTVAWSFDAPRNAVAWSLRARIVVEDQSQWLPTHWVTVVPATVPLNGPPQRETA